MPQSPLQVLSTLHSLLSLKNLLLMSCSFHNLLGKQWCLRLSVSFALLTAMISLSRKLSQTSFSHISINYLTILTVSMATESPWKDLSIDTSHISKQSILAEILGRSTGNYHSTVTNFIQPYLHQFFDDSHSLNGYRKPLKRPFNRYQSHLKTINIGWDIRQIN